MIWKLIAAFYFFIVVQNSEASALRCSDLFVASNSNAIILDQINASSNYAIFSASVNTLLNPDLTNTTILQNVKLRYRALSLARKLKPLNNSRSWDNYDFEKFSKKLSKLVYLTDPHATDHMTEDDRKIYLKAQHDFLTLGLKAYFFEGENVPKSVYAKVFNWAMLPFQQVYFRWSTALIYMPKLDGTVLSFEDASKILWDGPAAHPDIVAKYSLSFDKPLMFYANFFNTVQGKSTFNTFSKYYNRALLSALLLGLPAYGYLSFSKMQEEGQAQVTELLSPTLESSEAVNKLDMREIRNNIELNTFKENFKLKYGDYPSEQILARTKLAIEKRHQKN